jgi:hypothetical protein
MDVKCSFCRAPRRERLRFVAGPDARICDECAELVISIMREPPVPPGGSCGYGLQSAWDRLGLCWTMPPCPGIYGYMEPDDYYATLLGDVGE